MAKVVTESPRRGHANKSKKTGRRLSKDEFARDEDISFWNKELELLVDDHGALRHPVSRHRQHGWDAKEFSDLISPLERCLRKQVGRPWNTIYSELSASLDKRSLSGRHIWSHVRTLVTFYVRSVDGKFYFPPRRGSGDSGYRGGLRVTGLYIHPTTGLLCWARKRSFKYKPTVDENIHTLDAMRSLVRVEGIWYLTVYEMEKRRSHPFSQRLDDGPTVSVFKFEDVRVLKEKHQLNRKELRSYGLTNDPKRDSGPSRRDRAARAVS